MSETQDLFSALRPVVDTFQRLGIRYYVGGSVASSFHGAMRSTMDVDVVADLTESHVSELVSQLNAQYYVSETAIQSAIRRKSCFNLIHYATSFKVDIFTNRDRSYDRSAFSRAEIGQLTTSGELSVPIATAEDIILSKLEWYRSGGEVSERQWKDITIVLRLLDKHADWEYLRQFADQLGVADLLQKLLGELQL